jgi:hypothetical protein
MRRPRSISEPEFLVLIFLLNPLFAVRCVGYFKQDLKCFFRAGLEDVTFSFAF